MIKISIRSKLKGKFSKQRERFTSFGIKGFTAQKTGFRDGKTLRDATQKLRVAQAIGPTVGGKGVFREQRSRFGTSSPVGRAKNAFTRVRARIPSRLRLR